jgi:hypothetical protein
MTIKGGTLAISVPARRAIMFGALEAVDQAFSGSLHLLHALRGLLRMLVT